MDFFDILLAKKLEDDRDPTIEGLSVTENGTYSEEGKAYSPVIVEVPEPTLITKTITENGTYTASDDNADGYSQVTVNVPLPQNAKLITAAESYPITDAADYPLPKCEVTVANADKCEVIVTSDNTITENNAPYLYRATPSGNKVLNELVGGTVAWNQLMDSDYYLTGTYNEVVVTKNDNALIANGTANGNAYIKIVNNVNNPVTVSEHKYFVNIPTNADISYYDDSAIRQYSNRTSAFMFNGNGTRILSFCRINSGVTVTNAPIWQQIFDLTQMFGTTIADYIYSLEQATAGSGIARLKSYGFFTEDYYTYNAGELMSVKTSARKVYDSDSNLLATYLLSNIELRGIPKLVNNQLYYDGDRYEGNGRVTRKYGIVDLGTIANNIIYNSGYACWVADITELGLAKFSGNYAIPKVLDNKGFSATYFYTLKSDNKISVSDAGYLLIGNNSNSVKPDNIIVYELATPTAEQTSPYDNPQLAGSTEEFVDTREVAIPVGHESKYFNGEGYITYLDSNTSDTIDMAQEHAIMPLATTYISANGTLDVEYWK